MPYVPAMTGQILRELERSAGTSRELAERTGRSMNSISVRLTKLYQRGEVDRIPLGSGPRPEYRYFLP